MTAHICHCGCIAALSDLSKSSGSDFDFGRTAHTMIREDGDGISVNIGCLFCNISEIAHLIMTRTGRFNDAR